MGDGFLLADVQFRMDDMESRVDRLHEQLERENEPEADSGSRKLREPIPEEEWSEIVGQYSQSGSNKPSNEAFEEWLGVVLAVLIVVLIVTANWALDRNTSGGK